MQARRQALASLKQLLADPEAAVKRDGRPAVDAAFAQQALARLTAPELAALTDWPAAAAKRASIPWHACRAAQLTAPTGCPAPAARQALLD